MKNDSFSRVLLFLLALILAFAFFIGVAVKVSAAPSVVTVYFPDGNGGWQSSEFPNTMGSEPITFSYRDGSVIVESNGVVLLQALFDSFPLLYGTNSTELLSISSDPSNPQLEQYTFFTLPFEQVLTYGGNVVLFSYTGSVEPPEPDRVSVRVYIPNGVGGWDVQTMISVLPNYPVNFNSNRTITQDGLDLGSWLGNYAYATLDTSSLNKNSSSDLTSYVSSSTLTVPFEISFSRDSSIILFNSNYTPPPPDTASLKVYAPVGDTWTLIFEGPILKGEPYTFANGLVSSDAGPLVSDSRLSGFTYITLDSDILNGPVKSEDLSKYINGEVPYEQAFTSDVTVVYFNTYHAPPASPVISIGSDFVVRWSAVPGAGRYGVYVNGQLVSNPYPSYTYWDAYKYIDEVGTYFIYVVAVENVGGSSFSSEPSNTVTYVAAAPEITRFEIDSEDKVLYYSFTGPKAQGTLYRSSVVLEENISAGSYNLSLSELSGGLYGFQLTVRNKYGSVTSDSLDFYVGFDNDTYGTFYSIGIFMGNTIEMLDSVEFFGISLWMMMVTAFIITLIIPFLCIIVLPSRGFGRSYTPRGGNGKRSRKDIVETDDK